MYEKTCHLIKSGIVALLGPRTETIASFVKSMSRAYNIPYLETRWDVSLPPGVVPPSPLPASADAEQSHIIQIQPDINSLNRAYLDLISYFRWRKIFIVFDSAEGMLKVCYCQSGWIRTDGAKWVFALKLSRLEPGIPIHPGCPDLPHLCSFVSQLIIQGLQPWSPLSFPNTELFLTL